MSANLADLPLDMPADLPPVLTSSGKDEFKFGRSTPQICQQIYPPVLTSNGQDEFKFGRSTPHLPVDLNGKFWMFTIRAHIGRSPGRSTKHQTLQIPHRALCKGNVECI